MSAQEPRGREVGYALYCRVMRDGPPPPVRVRSAKDENGWHSVITWSQNYGTTEAFVGPFATRREAVLALRGHLKERRQHA